MKESSTRITHCVFSKQGRALHKLNGQQARKAKHCHRPFNVSAAGEKGLNASLLAELSIGIKLATLNKMKLRKTPGGSSLHCFKTVSPEDNSAANAEMKSSMANLPLIISGPGPEKAITSAMLTSWPAATSPDVCSFLLHLIQVFILLIYFKYTLKVLMYQSDALYQPGIMDSTMGTIP